MSTVSTLMQLIVPLAHEAGRRIMSFYRQQRQDMVKADSSPLTAADLASHEYLVERLAPLLPGVPVASEESAASVAGASTGRFWLIDPLDGTKEFIKATDEFTVNIALIENSKPVLGAVYAPALHRTYFGIVGEGAWRLDGAESAVPVVSRQANFENLSVVASKDHAGPLVKTLLARLPSASLAMMGSSLKFCLVAEGKADIYLRDLPTMEWDTAAAQAVVEAAGGGVYEMSGETLRYGKDGLKNPAIITTGDATLQWKQWLHP